MTRLLIFLLLLSSTLFAQDLTTLYERSGGSKTPNYHEVINWWKQLDKHSDRIQMQEIGMSDAGYPLHLITISGDKDFNYASLKKKNRIIILINNGIHPGEPDGIDASMLLARNIAQKKDLLPVNVVLAIIPVYNIGGCLNRGPNYRVDQDGPEEFGSRGNSQNLDLNRDFIKCDSKEALTFTQIFHLTDPDIFVDNHVSDGADYQHVMTLLSTQHDKLGGAMGEFLNKSFEPAIYQLMKEKKLDLIPYVNFFGDTPEKGWSGFWDNPRYGSGYAALWQTFSFVPETHMLKPYPQRVQATLALMQSFISFAKNKADSIRLLRKQAREQVMTETNFALSWQNDRTYSQLYLYKGFESGRKPSEVSGLPRLYYDRNKPFEKEIPIFNRYTVKEKITAPLAYILPQGWWKVVERLKNNQVHMRALTQDTVIEVEVYKITDYKAAARQYEMHHLNSDVKVVSRMEKMKFRKGDWYIPLNQIGNRFIVEVLEPQMEDSYFVWNFFDAVLSQKEGYSGYAFEDIAANYLKENPAARELLENRKKLDSTFAKDGRAQLNFVFQNSKWMEPEYMRYPVYRLLR